jgi:hypothetical protein
MAKYAAGVNALPAKAGRALTKRHIPYKNIVVVMAPPVPKARIAINSTKKQKNWAKNKLNIYMAKAI